MEKKTHEEFQELHSFLEAEETARIEALKREQEQKIRAVRQQTAEMAKNIDAVSETIRVLEEEMALEGVSILHVRTENIIIQHILKYIIYNMLCMLNPKYNFCICVFQKCKRTLDRYCSG